MPAVPVTDAARAVELLGTLILLSVFWMLAARQVYAAINAFAIQSALLAATAAVVGYTTGGGDLYVVAGLTIASKVVLITAFMRYVARRIEAWRELPVYVNIPASLIIGGLLVVLAYFSTFSIPISGAIATRGTLAIAVAVILIGLFLMISRAEVILQIIGLLTIENGLVLAALAIAYTTPLIVEFGIVFDVLVAVVILGVLAIRIRSGLETTSTAALRRLRG